MDYKKIMDRIVKMSFDEFQEFKKTPEYMALNREPTVRKEFIATLDKRRSNDKKRERILNALYENPEVFGLIKDIQDYRTLRIRQAWISIAIREGENDSATQSSWESLDRRRRQVHNKALKAFCKLVESTSPFSSRDNAPPQDGSIFFERSEGRRGDLYDGPLMIPYEEADNYGKPVVRDAMTTGMFQLLKLIEETDRSDWDRARSRVLDKKIIDPTAKTDILKIKRDLEGETRGYGMSEAPDKDDFGIDLFDDKDNKYNSSTRSGKVDGMEID